MGNLLRNLIFLLFALLFAFWLYTVAKSCNTPQRDVLTLEEASVNNGKGGENGEVKEADLEDLYEKEDGDVKAGDIDNATKQPELAEAGDDLEMGNANDPDEDAKAKAAEIAAKNKSNTSPNTNTNGSTFGKYLVVTGSYLSEANAKIMAKQLQKKGYHAAEVITFDLSQYYSVTAGRYATLSEARTVARNLKTEGGEAYVHLMRGKSVN